MGTITSYSAITEPASSDLLVVVDVNDTSMSASGTTKKMTFGQLYGSTAPWQFTPEAYGAKGNGRVLADGVTNGTTTFTSATAGFTSAVTGMTVMINGGNGTAAAPLVATMTYVSPTTVTLSGAAGASATGCAFAYGTDDTSAIQSCINAANAYALANDYFAEVLFGAKIYMLATGPAQTTSPFQGNAQLQVVPSSIALNGQSRKLVLSLKGAGSAAQTQFWESVVPNLQGTCLVSTVTAPSSASGTYGEQSVIGGPSASGAFTGSTANFKAVIDGITVWAGVLPNLYAYDFGYIGGMEWGSFAANCLAPAANESGATAAHPWLVDLAPGSAIENTIGAGCRFPLVGNNDDVAGVSFSSQGYNTPIIIADHFTAVRVASIYCDAAGKIDLVNGISNLAHAVTISQWSIENMNAGLTCNGGGSGYCQVNIVMDAESPGGANPNYDVNDNGNLYGVVRIGDPGRTQRSPTISGGAPNLKIINDMMGPGYWPGAPSVPGSAGAQQNTAWRDAWVTITSGGAAVSAIAVDGQATGLTLGTSGAVSVRVPSGKNITLTYASTAPTWLWWLD